MSENVLIVEDESSIAENINYALSTEGFSPLWCDTGKEALEILSNEKISLIILDIGLPDMNGFDLMRQIRKTHQTPVIFVTARADEIDRIVGLEIGADDYVVKPFSPRELTARVRAVLRRTLTGENEGRQAPEGSLTVPPPFKLDEDRLTISYYEKPLELSRYEYRLLRLLITNPSRVFTREQLMDRVWEEPEMSLDRTVDTHIKTLRQKLKAVQPEEDPIVTHRGIGYSVRENT